MDINDENNKQDDLEEIHYPDDIEFSEEQERAIREAIRENADDDVAPIDITEDDFAPTDNPASEPDFSHLAPPKKSPVKIIVKVLFILIIIGAIGFGAWYFWWTQYATFDYTLNRVVLLDGQTIDASVFLPENEISRGVTAKFINPEFSPVSGPAKVQLTLSLGLRSLDTEADLYVLTPLTQIVHEFREEAADLTPQDLLKNSEIARNVNYDISFTEAPLPLAEYEIGSYTINATLNGAPFSVNLAVSDTTLPIAVPKDVRIEIGEEITADMFVTDIFDHSEPVSVVFVGNYEGEETIAAFQDQIIEINLIDAQGNTNTYAASLIILKNESPPEFKNLPSSIESMVNTPLEYPVSTVAVDDFGREIEIVIDDTDVDISETGQYTVTYTAEDYSGLKTQVEIPVYIINIDPDEVNDWVNEKLGEIINPGMTDEEIVRAVFEQVRKTINPSSSLSTEWNGSLYTAAHYAINNPTGTYYHYYALSEIMLTSAGIENMRIERSNDSKMDTPHFWNLVKIDDVWYHYDSMYITNWNAFNWMNAIMHMFTQAQAEEIAKQLVDFPSVNKEGYYDYDKDEYPDIKAE